MLPGYGSHSPLLAAEEEHNASQSSSLCLDVMLRRGAQWTHTTSELYVKLPPTLSSEKQSEGQPWCRAQPPTPVSGERGQPVSLANIKLILSLVQKTSKE